MGQSVSVRFQLCHVLALVMLVAGFVSVIPAQVDHPCVPDPVFPPDCVDQLGAIGTPAVSSAQEGFLNISSPVVDPLVLLQSSNASDGLLYVLNPLNNRVRVLDPANGLSVEKNIRWMAFPRSFVVGALARRTVTIESIVDV